MGELTTKKKNSNLSLLLRRTASRLKRSEQEVLDEIVKVCNLIATNLHFGYFDREDIEQEGIILGLEVLRKYDPERPISNFLYTHIRNRILNIKRKNFTRTDPPCRICHEVQDGHTAHDGGRYCESYEKWYKINSTKRSLMQPLELEEKPLAAVDVVAESAEVQDLLKQIDMRLPVEMRATYLRMRSGDETVDSVDRAAVEDFVKELMYED